MPIAKILVPLSGTKRDANVLKMVALAARPFNAHVVALFAHPDPRLAAPYAGTPISPVVVQDIVTPLKRWSAVPKN